jgi:hypothetical protein
MVDLHLGDLVAFCLARRTPSDSFHVLLKQLNHKHEVSEQDVETLLSTTEPFDPLLVVYISTIALTDQTTNLKFSNVLSSLRSATETNQYLILGAFATEFRNEKENSSIIFSNLEINENIQSMFKYLKYLLDQKQDSDAKLFQSFTNLMIVLLPKLNHASSMITPEQTDLLATFIIETKSKSETLSEELDEILAKFTKRGSLTGSLRQSISINPSISGYNSHSGFLKSNKLPKYIWLNSAILNWSTNSENFLSSFDQFVKVKTKKNTLNELLAISFQGYVIAIQSKSAESYFLQAWKLFLLKKLPLLIKELNLKNVESSLTSAFHLVDPKILQNIKHLSNGSSSDANFDDMFSSFPSTTTDVRHDFLKSCIALQLLPPSAFKAILNDDAAADGRSLPTTDEVFDENNLPVDFQDVLNASLIDINTEFIPLEDSGLLEFLNSISSMEGSKQLEVSRLILSTTLSFIKEDDRSHLYRLALALALSPDSLTIIVFHLSPRALLKPLMNFLDKSQTDFEDINFQDNYSAFGCVFLLFLIIVKAFNISLSELISYKEDLNQPSFCIKYVANLGSSRQLIQKDANKEEILRNWMTALFDSGGISDELMRLSTVQDCFEIFPGIFQQAFIGCRQGIVDIDTVKGGLEYFLQPFLLSTIVGFVVWSENYLWKNQDVDIIVNLLKTLLSPLDLGGESVYIHKVILGNFTNGLYKVLAHLDASPAGSNIDPVFLSHIRQASEKDNSPSGFFKYEVEDSSPASLVKSEESSSGSRYSKKRTGELSFLESFHQKFSTMVNWSQSSNIPTIDYHNLETLVHLLGVDKVIDYFLSQISSSQSLPNGKTSQLLLEVSSFFLVVTYLDSNSKNHVLKSLKSESLSDGIKDVNSDCFKLVKSLITRKKSLDNRADLDNDVFLVFYEKLIEDIQIIGTVN